MDNLEQVKSELIALLPRLQRYAQRLNSSTVDAEEVVQLTCIRVLEKYQQFVPGTNFDRWAFTVLSSVHKNFLRTQSKHNNLSKHEVQLQVEDTHEINTQFSQILSLVNQLSVDQSQPILLVYVEGFSYQEAADILDVPIGTVMSRIARGRVKLATSMNLDDYADHGDSR